MKMFSLFSRKTDQTWFLWTTHKDLDFIFLSFSISSWRDPWKIECHLTNKTLELDRNQMNWIIDDVMRAQKQQIKTLDELERFLKLKTWS